MDARYNDELYFGSRPIFGSAAPQIDIPEPEVTERPQEKVSIRTKAKPAAKQGEIFALSESFLMTEPTNSGDMESAKQKRPSAQDNT